MNLKFDYLMFLFQLGLYKSVMRLMNSVSNTHTFNYTSFFKGHLVKYNFGFSLSLIFLQPSADNGERTIFILNISSSEARNLREALKKIDSVKNYLLLLNKV